MKAALQAWGSGNLFHQRRAKERTDPDVIAAMVARTVPRVGRQRVVANPQMPA
jgi:hypothetical protein